MRTKLAAGFTLIELLLVVAALGIVAGIAIPFSNSSIVRGDLSAQARTVETSLRRAYTYARAGENNSNWGAHVSSSSVVVFSGTTYAGRDVTRDEATPLGTTPVLGGTLVSGGVTDVVFTKDTGAPVATGTITLTAAGTTKTITINEAGAVLSD